MSRPSSAKRVRRRPPATNEYRDLLCEWFDCHQQFTDLTKFLQHLHTVHVGGGDDDQDSDDNEDDDEDECGPSAACQWEGCDQTHFATRSHFRLHVSYHGFHQKLMSAGLVVMSQLGDSIVCYADTSARNILPELPKVFVCGWKECYTEFVDTESFYRHVDTHAVDDIVIPVMAREELRRTKFAKCDWLNCESRFVSKSHLKEHLRSHTQQKLIACPSCGAMFCNRTKFVDHIYRSAPTDLFKTDSLTIELSKSDHTLTIRVPHTDSSSSILIQNPNSDNELMLIDLANPALSKSADSSDELQEVSSGVVGIKRSATRQLFQCEHCDREYATPSLLREHARRHITKYKCDACDLVTTSPSALRHHITYRHRDERPYSCQFCDFKFKSRSDLRRHIDTHNEEPQFKCPLCAFQARCVHTYSKHHKEVHQAIKCQYVCHECDKIFSRGNNLTRHLITIHKYALPAGCSRFQYVKQEDGSYRLLAKTIDAQQL